MSSTPTGSEEVDSALLASFDGGVTSVVAVDVFAPSDSTAAVVAVVAGVVDEGVVAIDVDAKRLMKKSKKRLTVRTSWPEWRL